MSDKPKVERKVKLVYCDFCGAIFNEDKLIYSWNRVEGYICPTCKNSRPTREDIYKTFNPPTQEVK